MQVQPPGDFAAAEWASSHGRRAVGGPPQGRSPHGGGFAVDLVTHRECVSPFPHPPFHSGSDPEELKEWIPADVPVIKLAATL
jgi:hypothetical protein